MVAKQVSLLCGILQLWTIREAAPRSPLMFFFVRPNHRKQSSLELLFFSLSLPPNRIMNISWVSQKKATRKLFQTCLEDNSRALGQDEAPEGLRVILLTS